MARPQKQTVDYFPHRCKSGKTMFILETRYDDKGYTFWFKLLELLGLTEGHTYQFNSNGNCEYLQAYTRTTKEQATEILELLASLDAIDKELWNTEKIIWSDNFIDGVKDAYRNRVVDIPIKPVSNVRNKVNLGVTEVRNPQRRGEESKEEKSRINYFELFWKEYPIKIGKDKAYKVFKGIKPDKKLLDSMIVAIVKQKEWREHNNGFTPEWKHPATWLNSGCWNDEIPEVNNAKIKGIRSSSRRLPDRDKYTEPYSD